MTDNNTYNDGLVALSTPSGKIALRSGGAGGSDGYRLIGTTTGMVYQWCPASLAQARANALEAAGAS